MIQQFIQMIMGMMGGAGGGGGNPFGGDTFTAAAGKPPVAI